MLSQSMTGFGKGEASSDQYDLSVEMKSVNHRFKDIRFKMGSVFNSKEIELRKKIESNFARGSFDVYISYKKNTQATTNAELDYTKINNFVSQLKNEINIEGLSIQVNPTEFLRSDFILEDTDKEEHLHALLEEAFAKALENLQVSRKDEGQKLVEKLKEHKAFYLENYQQIPEFKEGYQAKVKEKILKKFETESKDLPVDEPRFLQEVIYYLEKLDIDEEINRIKIHLEKLDSLLDGKKPELGRQIDFLIQELNRETNTIGSKSGSNEISERVVQMKVQLEKIREQALNLQ